MATLSISVAGLTGKRQYDDAIAADVLLKFYASRAAPDDGATQQQKLDAIIGWLEAYIVEGARLYEYEQRRRTLREEIDQEIGFGTENPD